MKRWTMWMAVALMAAAVPVARLAVAQDHPAHAPDAAHDAADDDGGGDWVALDVEAAMVEGPAMGGHGGFGGGRHARALAKELNLSDDQKKRIEAVHDQHRRKAIAMRADLETAQLDLRKLLRAETPDRRAIDAQVDRTVTLRGQLQKARMNAMLDARAVLTPEQREKMQDLRDSHARMRGHGRRGPGPGPGSEGGDM